MDKHGKTRKRIRQLYCHLCGSQFGTASLKIHWKSCGKKFENSQLALPSKRRVKQPAPPDATEFPMPTMNSKDVVFEKFNKEVLRIFGMLTEEQKELRERKRRDAAARVIQSAWRCYLARCRARARREELWRRKATDAAIKITRWLKRSIAACQARLRAQAEAERRRLLAQARWRKLQAWLRQRRVRRDAARARWRLVQAWVEQRMEQEALQGLADLEDELGRLETFLLRKYPYLLKGGGFSSASVAALEWKKRQAEAAGRVEELKQLILETREMIARKYSNNSAHASKYADVLGVRER